MIVTAHKGGVMHPTGFPLQAWLNRALVELPMGSLAQRLSILNVLCDLASLILLMRLLKLWEIPGVLMVIGAILFGFDTILFSVSIYPEKYSMIVLSNLLLIFLHQLFFRSDSRKRNRIFLLFSLCIGLGLSQHTSLLAMAPLWLHLFHETVKQGELSPQRRLWHCALSVLCALAPPVLLYDSLVWLRTDSVWVDWGALRGPGDVLRHFLRADFQYVGINPRGVTGHQISTLQYWWLYFSREWNLLLLFVPLGIYGYVRQVGYRAIYLLLSMASVFTLLWIAYQEPTEMGAGYMERYLVLTLPFLVPFSVRGIGFLWKKVRYTTVRYAASGVIAACLIYGLPAKYACFEETDNNLIDVYRELVKKELPPDAIYVTANDWELFYGLPENGGYRFPVFDMMAFPWFARRTFPRLEPRLYRLIGKYDVKEPWSLDVLLQLAWEEGLTLASTDREALKGLRDGAHRKGLVWIAGKDRTGESAINMHDDLKEICEGIGRVRYQVPRQGGYFNKVLLGKIGESVAEIVRELNKASTLDGREAMSSLRRSIVPGVAPETWRRRCEEALK
ncbi:MAG: DUF2723 domain-containing protein [Deltaproteobacteria bacterium]|nr:DUF2723 domain-containing protein [Deltaproteobacteria bacterium]